MERSGSFRESMESRTSFQGMPTFKNGNLAADMLPPSQYLLLEPLSMSEQKYSRFSELRRVLGVPVEEHPFGGSVRSKPSPSMASEELKRFKASVVEISTRARDRSKVLSESILKLDKFRNLCLRKHQRSEIASIEKTSGSGLLKLGCQIHQSTSDFANQRMDERNKNNVPNRRVRSSLAEVRSDGRSGIPSRSAVLIDKEKNMPIEKNKNMLRTCNGGTMLADDKVRGLAIGGDGWDKKMKRKRSVGTMVNRTMDGDQEFKPTIQPRPGSEPHSRSSEVTGIRSGLSSVSNGTSKMEANSQLPLSSSRVMPKNDLDNAFQRERPAIMDKEKILAKGSNKLSIHDDIQAGSQGSSLKAKASRAPRTGLGGQMNSATAYTRTLAGIDGWEQSCTNKAQSLSGSMNRKRPLPTESSPPVAQWVGQRPQKNSRTRRANVVSPVSNFDELPASSEGITVSDSVGRPATLESSGSILSRGLTNGIQQSRLKIENAPSPAEFFSEAEETCVVDMKSKDREMDTGETENAVATPVLKLGALVLPAKKNKVSSKDDTGDGVRRQGRSGRGSPQSKPCSPSTKEKSETFDTGKPVRTGRTGSDKMESRVGRPPKKGSDRKGHGRLGQMMNASFSDLTGEPDDCHEDLVAVAKSACNAGSAACSGPFWNKMEPVFSFAKLNDINYVKQQVTFAEQLEESLAGMLDTEHKVDSACLVVPSCHSQSMEQRCQPSMVSSKSSVTSCSADDSLLFWEGSGRSETEKWFQKMVPLSQRLLSAFIIEDGSESFDCENGQNDILCSSNGYVPYGTNRNCSDEYKAPMKQGLELDLDFNNQKKTKDNYFCNGYSPRNLSKLNIQKHIFSNELQSENNVSGHSSNSFFAEIERTNLNRPQNLGMDFSSKEDHYENMSLDERILMELHSIGLYPDAVPDLAEGEDEELDKDILEVRMTLCQQVRKNKRHLHKLERSMQNAKQADERNLEQLAMDKLVDTAYKKLTGGRGSHSHKSGASKVSRLLARSFAARALGRCKKFEETGRSCFSESPLRDVLSAHLPKSDTKSSPVSLPRAIAFGATASSSVSNSTEPSRFDASPCEPSSPNSARSRKREVLLDDVASSSVAWRAMSLSSHTALNGGAKGKRSERDKDSSLRGPSTRIGRPPTAYGRGERKAKTKQKTAQLSASGCGVVGGRAADACIPASPASVQVSREEANKAGEKEEQGTRDLSKEVDDTLLTSLPLHDGIDSMEELDVAEGLGGQGQDIGSWLNVDDDALQDHDDDLVGLEIPMDDLSELKLAF